MIRPVAALFVLALAGTIAEAQQAPMGPTTLVRALKGHEAAVNKISFSPDGKTLVSASDDKTVRLWDVATGRLLNTLRGHADTVSRALFSPDGKVIASSGADKTVRLWDARSGQFLKALEGHSEAVYALAWSSNGKWLASGGGEGKVKAWDVATGEVQRTDDDHGGPVYALAVNPRRALLAAAQADKTIRFWDGKADAPVLKAEGHAGRVYAAAWSGDGQILATASEDRTVRLWRVGASQASAVLSGMDGPQVAVDVSRDGELVAAAGHDRTLRIWDVETSTSHSVVPHEERIYGVAFSPDGKLVATASGDRTIRIWSVAGGGTGIAAAAKPSTSEVLDSLVIPDKPKPGAGTGIAAVDPAAERQKNPGGTSIFDSLTIKKRPPDPAPAEPAPAPVVVQPSAGAQALAVPAPAVAPLGKRVALVIGNSAYQSVARLANPPKDAALIAATLKLVGFASVDTVSDASRDGMVTALRAFEQKANGADWAVIYYAGHGMEMGGQNYLIPVDARLRTDRDVQDEAVPLSRVMAALDGTKSLKIIVLDACRDNPFAAQMQRANGTRSVTRGLARVEPEGALLVAYAAKGGETAQDGDGGNSPFAAALATRLKQPGLEINKVFRLVRDDVLAATAKRQEPFVYGSLGGEDYFFNPRQ